MPGSRAAVAGDVQAGLSGGLSSTEARGWPGVLRGGQAWAGCDLAGGQAGAGGGHVEAGGGRTAGCLVQDK